MASWVQNVELGETGVVGYTVVAGWWTTTYHRVITFEVKIASATEGISVLTRQLCEAFPEKCDPARDYFVTRVHKIDRYGMPKSNDPECEAEHADRARAC